MAAIGSVFQIRTQYQLTAGQQALTVCHYEMIAGNVDLSAENVADEFITEVLVPVSGQLSEDYSINRVFVINGQDNEDFNDTNPALTGQRTGFSLPHFLAAGIRGPFPGPGFHRARHNLPIGSGSDLVDQGFWGSPFRTAAQAIADKFGVLLEHSNGALQPVTIAGSFQLGVNPVVRASALGQWEINFYPTTIKTRQEYLWNVVA